MTGTTTTPGNISFVSDSTTAMTSGRSGDGLLGVASPTNDTATFGSAKTSTSVVLDRLRRHARQDRGSSRSRVAICGSALLAWPPASRVATHVVRIIEFQ